MPQCLYITIRNDSPVSCGKCMYCRNKRIAGWSSRLLKRDMVSAMSFFMTYTYDTEHLMFCSKGRPTLYPSHLQNYWKLLRKKFPKGTISYYACGEYGSNRKRPHYHAIVFIQDFNISPVQALAHLEKTWIHGESFAGTVTGDSVAYVLKYLSKKGSVPQYPGDTRTKEFQRVSKGMGKEYLTDQVKAWHLDDLTNRAYMPLPGGGRAPLPRYYKDKIYSKEQKAEIGRYMEQNEGSREYVKVKELRHVNLRKMNL